MCSSVSCRRPCICGRRPTSVRIFRQRHAGRDGVRDVHVRVGRDDEPLSAVAVHVVAWKISLGQCKLPVSVTTMSCSLPTEGLRAAMAPRPMAWMVAMLASVGRVARGCVRAHLAGVGLGSRHQHRPTVLGKRRRIRTRVSTFAVTAGYGAAHHRACRSTDDHLGHLVGDTVLLQALHETFYPGGEVFAAAAEHQRAVLSLAERGFRREGQ